MVLNINSYLSKAKNPPRTRPGNLQLAKRLDERYLKHKPFGAARYKLAELAGKSGSSCITRAAVTLMQTNAIDDFGRYSAMKI